MRWFFPRVSVRLTAPGWGWLSAAALLAITGLWKNINLILLVAYFLIGLLIWNFFIARRMVRRLTVRRRSLPPVFANEDAPCEYEMVNRGSFSASQTIIEDRPFDQKCAWPAPSV